MSNPPPPPPPLSPAAAPRPGVGAELIRLKNIHKTYRMGNDLVPVLRGVDLVVREGEFVAIMGASGSGKSTLLHIAGALDTPDFFVVADKNGAERRDRGDVLFRPRLDEDEDAPPAAQGAAARRAADMISIAQMGRWARHWLRNREFGFVFQFYHLLPELTVLENVLLPSMVRAPLLAAFVGARPNKDRALELLEAFGLTHRLRHRPGQLSGGERQRVAIARALINGPALLLADEPTGNLDAKTGRAILDVLLNLHRSGGQTMLLVTHDPNVAALADRTVHLVEGRIKT
jgi:lipoprotein-releasing system ATP-binding protein